MIARALAGEPAAALAELRAAARAHRAVGPAAVERLCAGAGLIVEARHGIGVFSDLVPGAALDAPGARDALAELDAEAADRSPFAEIAGRVHLLARRPARLSRRNRAAWDAAPICRAPPARSTATTPAATILHVDMDAFFASVEIKTPTRAARPAGASSAAGSAASSPPRRTRRAATACAARCR